jgi:hypothetical protein
VNGNGVAWKAIITKAESERAVFCKHLEGKALFAGVTHLYAATHAELSSTLKTEEEESPGEFHEQRRRKRNTSDELPTAPKKMVPAAAPVIATKNFFTPLRTTRMDTDGTSTETVSTQEEGLGKQVDRPP